MKKYLFLIILISLCSCKKNESKNSTAQNNDQKLLDSLKKEYQDYYKDLNDPNKYVSYIGTTGFCYDKERVKIHKILFSDTKDERLEGFKGYGALEKISDSVINTFSIKERLVYALVYPEFYSQTCGYYIQPDDYIDAPIMPNLPRGPEGYYASERQHKALEKNIDSVAIYLNNCYENKEEIPLELYHLIIKNKIYKTIPMLLKLYKKKQSPFVLPVFIALMFEDNYQPFMNSELLKKMKHKFYKGRGTWDLQPLDNTPERIQELLFHTKNYYEWKLHV